MTRLLLLMVAVPAFITLLAGCDGDDPEPRGAFTLNGQSYDLARAFVYEGEIVDTLNGELVYTYEVGLVSGSVDLDLGLNVLLGSLPLVGKGNVVYLQLNSTTSGKPAADRYVFSDDKGDETLTEGGAGTDVSFTEVLSNTDKVFQAIGGEVQMSVVQTDYTIAFEMQVVNMGDTSVVTGTYTGELERVSR
ncbi:MAG: hypothetical protein WBA12_00870 [Catalinimonas sp.]